MLPHHALLREDHETTKLRIVFNAFSKSDGLCLNDCLYKAPQLTLLIYDILLPFRTFLFALTANIQSAFLQMSMTKMIVTIYVFYGVMTYLTTFIINLHLFETNLLG